MALFEAAFFELRGGPIEGPVTIVLAPLVELEQRAAGEQFVDMLGVVLPVRGDVQCAVRCEPAVHELEKIGFQDAPLVMPFLRPRIGKVQVQSRHRTWRKLVREHVQRVVRHDTPMLGLLFGSPR